MQQSPGFQTAPTEESTKPRFQNFRFGTAQEFTTSMQESVDGCKNEKLRKLEGSPQNIDARE